jgi:uncharacterized membrane protein
VQSLSDLLKRYKYHLAVVLLLGLASVVCVVLLGGRIAVTNSSRYLSLVWNLFLAWIPVVCAYLALAFSGRRALLYAIVPVFAFLWLIFFPNAPYILTDLQHLAVESGNVPVWFDVILLIWFSWTGVLLGIVSLYVMQIIVSGAFGRAAGWVLVFGASLLGSLGIYIGRFLRFNSWDILQNPGDFAVNILGFVVDPSLRFVAFTSLLAAFFLFVYCTLYAFGHLLQENSGTRVDLTPGADKSSAH